MKIVAVLAVLALAGCAATPAAPAPTATTVVNCGFEVSVASPPKRIVTIKSTSTELVIAYLRPFEESWDVDPEVTCLVSDGGTSTGSLKGANR